MVDVNLATQSLDICIKEIDNWGSTSYQNICSGTLTKVDWGWTNWFWAWIGYGMAIIIAIALVISIVVFTTVPIVERLQKHNRLKNENTVKSEGLR